MSKYKIEQFFKEFDKENFKDFKNGYLIKDHCVYKRCLLPILKVIASNKEMSQLFIDRDDIEKEGEMKVKTKKWFIFVTFKMTEEDEFVWINLEEFKQILNTFSKESVLSARDLKFTYIPVVTNKYNKDREYKNSYIVKYKLL